MRFKYKYEHLHCGFCLDVTDAGCSHALCPHILENLDDLRHDPEFQEAVALAENCPTFHRPTLIMLMQTGEGEAELPVIMHKPSPDHRMHASFKPGCAGCPFPSHGFICFDERDGSCMKTDYDAVRHREKSHAGC